jgi:hypothetical protein
MSAQQFEHDGFNSPNEVEMAKRAALHTPGPLVLRVGTNGDVGIISTSQKANGKNIGGALVAECFTEIRCAYEGANAEALANATLFAASLDLVAALRPFAAFACSPPGECACHNCRARDVIAQATGSAA